MSVNAGWEIKGCNIKSKWRGTGKRKILLFQSYKQKYMEDEEGKGCWEENAFVDKEQQFCPLHR